MKIQVVSCNNSLLWYARYIGQTFEVLREEETAYWCREPNSEVNLINWIYKKDVKVVNEKE